MTEQQHRNLRVAIAGQGFGERVILPCLSAVDGLKVTAWVSRQPDTVIDRLAPLGIGQAFGSIDDLIRSDAADVLCIATPPTTHAGMAIPFLEAGKSVICEKPLAASLADAEAMAQAAERAKGFAIVDHQLRFHPCLARIRDLIAADAVGRPVYVDLSYKTATRLDPAKPGWNWWSDRQQSGGQLFALGSHMLDLMQWWFGGIARVTANLARSYDQRTGPDGPVDVTTDDVTMALLEFESGLPAMMNVSSVDADEPMMRLRVAGTEGVIDYVWDERLVLHRRGGGTEDHTVEDEILGAPGYGENAWRAALVRLGRAIAASGGGQPGTAATFQEALRTQRVLEAIRRAADERAWINI